MPQKTGNRLTSGSEISLLTLLATLFYGFTAVDAQILTSITTTTIFTTVSNDRTVTSNLGDCNTWSRLPLCDAITWEPGSISSMSSSTPTSTTISITSTSSTTISTPSAGEAFVLRGRDIFAGLSVQFDDNTGRVVLANFGASRFVSFVLSDNNDGLLRNAIDEPIELALARFNSSANNAAFSGEALAVRSNIREIRHAINGQGNILSSDYLTKWLWNSTTGEPQLLNDGILWAIYQVRGSSAQRKRAASFDLYMLPAGLAIPEDSSLERSYFVAENAKNHSSLLSSDSSTTTSNTISTFEYSTSITSTSTTIFTPTSTTTTRSSTSRSQSSSSSSSSSSPDAYDLITQLTLENYCTELLSYNAPVTTSVSTSLSTSYYAAFTGTATTVTTTETSGRSTSITIASSGSTGRRYKRISAQRRTIPDQLTNYPSESVSSACSKITSLLSSTSTMATFTDSVVLDPIQSTLIASTEYVATTTSVDVVIETANSVGYARLSNSNFVDTAPSSTFFGYYLTSLSFNDAGSCGRVLVTRNQASGRRFSIAYSKTNGGYQLYTNETCVIGFRGVSPASSWSTTSDPGLSVWATDMQKLPFILQYDEATAMAIPDYAKAGIGEGTFWACLAAPSLYALYYYPSGFTSLGGYVASTCNNTGLDRLKFEVG
ncbi:hypothetical protein TWF730_002547 [Orbilia blumenaviensis]|uniref:Uncharacterized protein n=1 Tax=Orbilia blumenaviensis TaxID=1796055 RepID=A0AAV9UB28_9PEZI